MPASSPLRRTGQSADIVFHHEAGGFQHCAGGVDGINFAVFHQLAECKHELLLRNVKRVQVAPSSRRPLRARRMSWGQPAGRWLQMPKPQSPANSQAEITLPHNGLD